MKEHLAIVVLRKLAEAPDASVPAAPWATYIPGGPPAHGVSLPVGYEVEGELLAPITLGQPLRLRRFRRNGIDVLGTTSTSPILEVRVRTPNSIYSLWQKFG